ncbi:sugar ABC transporter substrate-binding protein, partial [Streptococcus pyogenes]
MKFKSILKATTVVAFASFLVACGNSTSGSGSGAKEVEFFSQKPEMQATLQEIVDDYNK